MTSSRSVLVEWSFRGLAFLHLAWVEVLALLNALSSGKDDQLHGERALEAEATAFHCSSVDCDKGNKMRPWAHATGHSGFSR